MMTVGLYSDSAVIGGAERSLLNLAAAVHRSGASNVVVCSTHPALLHAADRIAGVRTHLVVSRRGFVGAALDHARAFRHLGLDVVQVTLSNPFESRPAIAGGVIARIPTVAVEQLVRPSNRRRGRALKRLFAASQAKTIAVGEATADQLHHHFGIPRSSIAVAYNGVPAPHAERAVTRSSAPSVPVVGCAARLEDQKGIDYLLQAMAAVPDARLVLVGDGERCEDLTQQANQLGIAARVQFTGWVDDAPERIARFDVFALASRNEAFPLTIVEAMLAGTPVVATDVGSVAEAVIDGETGLLVPSGDVAALTSAIRQLLDDAALRTRLADAARQRAQRLFTDDAMAQAYQRVWQQVVRR